MRQPVNHKSNSSFVRVIDVCSDSAKTRTYQTSGLDDVRGPKYAAFSLRRCVLANLMLALAIVCRLGFSDIPSIRPHDESSLIRAAAIEPMCADWIGDLIDTLGGGGVDDDEDDPPREPNP